MVNPSFPIRNKFCVCNLWSSHADDTPVGAEYYGRCGWRRASFDLASADDEAETSACAPMDKSLSRRLSRPFSGGYLYYREDLPAQITCDIFVDGQTDEEFVLWT